MHRFTIVITTLIVLAAAGVAVFVWPTFYRYDNVSGRQVGYYMIKTNRLTGVSYGLTRTGWHELGMPKEPAKPSREIDVTEALREALRRERERGQVEAPAAPAAPESLEKQQSDQSTAQLLKAHQQDEEKENSTNKRRQGLLFNIFEKRSIQNTDE